MGGVLSAAGKVPPIVIAVAVTVVSSFFMAAGYDKIAGFIKNQLSPAHRRGLSAAKRIAFSSLGGLLRAYLIIIMATFVELTLGLLLLRLLGLYSGEYLVGIAAVTALVDIMPVLGTSFVVVPWALYSFIMGRFGLGLGLMVMLTVIWVVRQIIEPKLIASNLGLPPVATLAGMYIGLQLFGFIGIFMVPLLLILLKLLNDEGVVKIWKK